jgi:hypothetical protein
MQTPTSTTQLQQWLADSTPRVILLTSIMDFTNFCALSLLTLRICHGSHGEDIF